ncbi:MAG: RecX family transcriptional regulator [Chloroherpetonaceae bacterium]
MTITSIEPQKKRAARASIFVDGEFALGLSLDALASLGLKKGDHVTAEQLAQWRDAAIYDEAKTAAFTMLARRIHSEKEVRNKLHKKKFPPETIEKVIVRLYEMNLLNDAQFAGALVRDKLKRTPIGKSALKSKLFQKGIAKETIDDVLNETDLNSEALCTKAAERKLKTLQKEPDARKRKQKLSQFLMRRGFDWETIRATFRTLGV